MSSERVSAPRRRHPAWFVPSLYFSEGLPYNIVNGVLAVMYKNLGVSNAAIALHTSLLVLAWTVKPLWSPLVEMFATKRLFVLGTEFAMAVTLGLTATALGAPSFMPLTLALMWMLAFSSATQDIAADGLYISVMNAKEQSQWVGVQGFFWILSKAVVTGSLVTFSGVMHRKWGYDWPTTWAAAMLLCAGAMAVLGLWHLRFLPRDPAAASRPTTVRAAFSTFAASFSTFFRKPHIARIIAFITLYKLSQGLIDRVGPLFLLDDPAVGGLGLSNQLHGSINGTFGTAGILAGTVLAGLFVGRFGLNRRTLMVLCIALNIPNAIYVYLAQALPQDTTALYFWILLEKFGMGFGEVGLMLYMMQQVAPGPFRTAHYAFATGLMNLGYTIGGMPSGWIQEQVGYVVFFGLVVAATVPSFVATYLAPFTIRYDRTSGEPLTRD